MSVVAIALTLGGVALVVWWLWTLRQTILDAAREVERQQADRKG